MIPKSILLSSNSLLPTPHSQECGRGILPSSNFLLPTRYSLLPTPGPPTHASKNGLELLTSCQRDVPKSHHFSGSAHAVGEPLVFQNSGISSGRHKHLHGALRPTPQFSEILAICASNTKQRSSSMTRTLLIAAAS